MSNRTLSRLAVALRAARVLLLAALPALVILFWKNAPSSVDLTTQDSSSRPAAPPRPPSPGLEWYAPLWERDLKQPPIPPSAPEPAHSPAPPVSLPRLVATFVNGDLRMAHFTDEQGRLQLKSLDESIGGYRVGTIEPGRVQLASDARTLWVEVPKPKGP